MLKIHLRRLAKPPAFINKIYEKIICYLPNQQYTKGVIMIAVSLIPVVIVRVLIPGPV